MRAGLPLEFFLPFALLLDLAADLDSPSLFTEAPVCRIADVIVTKEKIFLQKRKSSYAHANCLNEH